MRAKLSDQPKTIKMEQEQDKVVILHAFNVWKGTYFDSVDQAFGAVRAAHLGESFTRHGTHSLVAKSTGAKFIAKEVRHYTGLTELLGTPII